MQYRKGGTVQTKPLNKIITTMKKLYPLMALIAVIFIAFTACSKKNADIDPITTDESPSTSSASKPTDKAYRHIQNRPIRLADRRVQGYRSCLAY
jgi:hypothetical protein